jgi:hypothetical protein
MNGTASLSEEGKEENYDLRICHVEKENNREKILYVS